MKRFSTLLIALFTLLPFATADEFTGKVVTISKANEMVAGKWYSLYHSQIKAFLDDRGLATLTMNTTPVFSFADDVRGELVQFETAAGGYYLKNAKGNYIKALTAQGAETSTTEKLVFQVVFNSADNSVTLKNDSYYLSSNGTYATRSTTSAAWTLYEVSLKAQNDLTAAQRRSLQDKQLKKTEGVLVRLKNKRSNTSYLTARSASEAAGATLKSTTEMSQIWLVKPNQGGNTFLNAQTGTYLTGEYATLGNETRLYVQNSPNNADTEYCVNISDKSDFSGQSCLNMGTNGTSLHRWSYANDPGSDWNIEFVHELTIQDVINNIAQSDPYVKTLEAGKYYRIYCLNKERYMSDLGTRIIATPLKEEDFQQYWTVTPSGAGYEIKNALTEDYIQAQTNMSQPFRTAPAANTMYVSRSNNAMRTTWYIKSSALVQSGMHCDDANNVVLWTNSNPNNQWAFVEATINETELQAARDRLKQYENMVANQAAIQSALDALFADKACTRLNPSIASLSDTQLEANASYQTLPADMQAMVKKVKNNTWGLKAATATTAVPDGSYERFFRISEYKPYSHYQNMAWETGQGYMFGRLSNPTGIYLPAGQTAYIYVDQPASEGVTLQLEAVKVNIENCGGERSGETTNLQQGLNLISYFEDKVLYIFHQVNNTSRNVTDFANAKIHIEGGTVYGVFDTTRGMKNQDWTNMTSAGLISNFGILNMKSDHLVMVLNRERTQSALADARSKSGTTYTDVEALLHIWNTIVDIQETYQNLSKFGDRLRNIWNVFSIDHQYMYATSNGTYYENSTLATVMNYHTLLHNSSTMWGPAHEIGHNHQALINCVGDTEVSNNLFSNIVMHESGISTTRGFTPKDNFTSLANGKFWIDRNIWTRTRMYFQLYLYFVDQGVDPLFLQKLFDELRKDPIATSGQYKNVTTPEGKVVYAQIVNGKDNYLKFAKKCCDASQTDLSEYFEAYGFFVPVTDYYVGDYSDYVVSTTQADIDEAKRYMKKYTKKAGNIMFINDFAEKHLAKADNKFGCIVPSGGYRNQYSYSEPQYTIGAEVKTGDYGKYNQTEDYQITGDYYTISGSTINFKGKNFLGHKVYDLQGNLVWASCNTSETIPSNIRSLFPDQVVVVGVDANMQDIPCAYYASGTSPVYKVAVTFPSGTTNEWWLNKNVDTYLPTNAVGVVTGNNEANDEVLGSRNIISKAGVAQKFVIDGTQPMTIPSDFVARSLVFTKPATGYQALRLPFDVADGKTIEGNKVVQKDVVAAGSAVVVSGNASYELSNAAVKAGEFKAQESGNVLSADAQSVVASEGPLTPFTFNFDSTLTITAINAILSAPDAGNHEVYDLNGRNVQRVRQGGLYIVNGKKALVK
ncbi:MAG: M60 family metallopeptidase [Prevotellaceae bacterium]|nr:M60 family metallopeptidase [Prevotellaceae bacterium]